MRNGCDEMILALETATNICSVALENSSGEISEKRIDARGSHSEKLFLFIDELMKKQQAAVSDLSAVLVSEGPGSYTGLRIAASGVKGLLFGSNLQISSVSTLASFAFSAFKYDTSAARIHAIIDARRVHVYHQLFEAGNGTINPQTEVKTVRIDSFSEMIQPGDYIIGTGIDRLDEESLHRSKRFGSDLISAQSLIQLYNHENAKSFVKTVEPGLFDPRYIH